MLTQEQQSTIENSLWVVNTALKRQGLSNDDDLRQDAMLYLCEIIQRFDESKGIKWTTYAYKSIYFYIKRIQKRKKKLKNREIDDEILDCDNEIYETLPSDETIMINDNDCSDKFELLKEFCSDEEKKILSMRLKGYRLVEIANELNYSVSTVNNRLRNIKETAKELVI